MVPVNDDMVISFYFSLIRDEHADDGEITRISQSLVSRPDSVGRGWRSLRRHVARDVLALRGRRRLGRGDRAGRSGGVLAEERLLDHAAGVVERRLLDVAAAVACK